MSFFSRLDDGSRGGDEKWQKERDGEETRSSTSQDFRICLLQPRDGAIKEINNVFDHPFSLSASASLER